MNISNILQDCTNYEGTGTGFRFSWTSSFTHGTNVRRMYTIKYPRLNSLYSFLKEYYSSYKIIKLEYDGNIINENDNTLIEDILKKRAEGKQKRELHILCLLIIDHQ